MEWLLRFWRSTVGAKVVMALTGVVLYGFVIVHMLGNLNVFLGEEAMNEYGAMLHAVAEVIWGARITLLTCLVLHIWSFLHVAKRTMDARPVQYAKRANRASTIYSRTMRISGVLVLAYLVMHLMNLTIGNWMPGGEFLMQSDKAPDAYHNLTTLLRVPWVAAIYLVCNVLLGFHLWHGSFSLFKTLGLTGERQLALARTVSWALSSLVVGGNVAITVSIVSRLVG